MKIKLTTDQKRALLEAVSKGEIDEETLRGIANCNGAGRITTPQQARELLADLEKQY